MIKKRLGQLRIIGGRWRGRKIQFSSDLPLRPTLDRIRETAFNWLMHDIQGARCLDLFTGSGALGFEALSRGASHVTFVDREPDVLKAISENSALLGAASQIDLVLGACPNALSLLKQAPFDIVFLDPPFRQGLVEIAANWLEEHDYLAPGALIFAETEMEAGDLTLPPRWETLHKKKTASLVYYLLRRG